ncbi:MAG: amidohydrolase family protein, partial [Clostridia bacterium]|nr:amidohydrolase family protein [Clostridia bacterium]
GATSVLPTVSSASHENIYKALENIEKAMSMGGYGDCILGAHLEGPYLSRRQSGAQCADFITAPCEREYLPLLEEYGDVIARWSYAPENDEGQRFARALAKHGVLAAAGHTDAIYDQLKSAMQEGCRLITHLYSCTSTVTRDHGFRRLGVIETAFLEDEMDVEIICDGKHLPPELIRLIYKIKGAEHIALITDSLALAGTDLTHGFMQSTEFIIEDGVCKLMDRSAFAGSIATADRLVRVAVKEAGIPLTDAVRMITSTPARIMGLAQKGSIAPCMDADLVVFDGDICIKKVFAKGKAVE